MLVTSDIHLTDREQDAYRWKLFPRLHQIAESVGGVDCTAFLGDLTEFKDNHSSELLHAIQEGVEGSPGAWTIVLKGNHDYMEESEPFFDWLGKLEGRDISYASSPRFYETEGILLLPHTRNPEREWKDWRVFDPRLVLTHMTVNGCQSEMGQILPGISRTDIPGPHALVVSGDIHKPQQLGPDFFYVGSPYSTRFSPFYEPQVVLLDIPDDPKNGNIQVTSIPTGLTKKVVVRVTAEEARNLHGDVLLSTGFGSSSRYTADDQIRLVVELPSGTLPSEWVDLRKELEEEVGIAGLPSTVSIVPHVTAAAPIDVDSAADTSIVRTPEDSFHAYCNANHITTELEEFGADYLRAHS